MTVTTIKLHLETKSQLDQFRDAYKKIMFTKRPKDLRKTKFIEVDGTRPLEDITCEITSIILEVIE